MPYCVLLKDWKAEPKPVDLAQAVASVRKAPVQDFLARARRAHGVVDTDLPQDQAVALVGALGAKGLPAVSLPGALLEEAPAPRPCPALTLGAAGLTLPADGAAPLAWERLALVAAAAVKDRQRKVVKTQEGPDLKEQAVRIGLSLATGIPLGFGGRKEVEKVVETSELLYYVDLVFDEPRLRLRVEAQDFDFSCLGARMGPAAAPNFRRLLEELVQRAPKALQGAATRALLASRPLAPLAFDDLSDLDRECRWLCTLKALSA